MKQIIATSIIFVICCFVAILCVPFCNMDNSVVRTVEHAQIAKVRHVYVTVTDKQGRFVTCNVGGQKITFIVSNNEKRSYLCPGDSCYIDYAYQTNQDGTHIYTVCKVYNR